MKTENLPAKQIGTQKIYPQGYISNLICDKLHTTKYHIKI